MPWRICDPEPMRSRWLSDFATEGGLSAVLHGARFAGGIAASGQNAGFGGNLFTRDACRMILDVMAPYPWLAREMLGVLPQEQGIQHDSSTNEFPDALPHQVFREVVGGRYAPSAQVEASSGGPGSGAYRSGPIRPAHGCW
jgi:hypothetical protein